MLLHRCEAFVAPSAVLSPRASGHGLLRASAVQRGQQAPQMVLSGLPTPTPASKKKLLPAQPPKKPKQSQINDDFPTTVGRAAFSSLKDKARELMVKGAEKRGLDWTGIVERLQVLYSLVIGYKGVDCCCGRNFVVDVMDGWFRRTSPRSTCTLDGFGLSFLPPSPPPHTQYTANTMNPCVVKLSDARSSAAAAAAAVACSVSVVFDLYLSVPAEEGYPPIQKIENLSHLFGL